MNFLDSRYLFSKATVPTGKWGSLTFHSVSFSPAVDGDLMVETGRPFQSEEPLVRIHSLCVFAEAFDSTFCDCKLQFEMAMNHLTASGSGLMFYLRLDGRGAGLAAKVKATALEIEGVDTYTSRQEIGVQPESREYDKIGRFLIEKGVRKISLLTNNPEKVRAMESCGLEVSRRPLVVSSQNPAIRELLRTKATKFGHLLSAESYE